MAGTDSTFRHKATEAFAEIALWTDSSDPNAVATSPTIKGSTTAASATEADGSLVCRTDGHVYRRVNGGWVREPVLLSVSTAASSAVTNTADETNFDTTATVPTEILNVAGAFIRIRYQGIATSTNGTDTLTIKLKIGSEALITTTAVDVADNNIFAGEFTIAIRTVGAGGTFVGWGTYNNPGAAASAALVAYKGSTAIDTTADATVAVSATWSAASASNSARLDFLSVEAY